MSNAVRVHPETLMSIRNLELRAKVVVEGYLGGLHRSPYHGFSVEFTEYRQYSPGDDPRYLDWKLYGRSDRYYIKKFEDETNLRCHLLLDNSLSMQYGSLSYDKAAYAKTLAATFAAFLFTQGDAVGLLSFDEEIREYLPARNRPGHLRHLMLALEKPGTGTETDIERPLRRIMEVVTKRGVMVLISDLLTPIDSLESQLAYLSTSGHEVFIFQILDPQELRFEFNKAVRFYDVESGRDVFVEPEKAREQYLGRVESHLAGIRKICARLGVGYFQFTTDRPLEEALYEFLRHRAQRTEVRRRNRRSSAPR